MGSQSANALWSSTAAASGLSIPRPAEDRRFVRHSRARGAGIRGGVRGRPKPNRWRRFVLQNNKAYAGRFGIQFGEVERIGSGWRVTLGKTELEHPRSRDHFVQLYEADESALTKSVGHYLWEGLRRGEGVMVVVTPGTPGTFRSASGEFGGECRRTDGQQATGVSGCQRDPGAVHDFRGNRTGRVSKESSSGPCAG